MILLSIICSLGILFSDINSEVVVHQDTSKVEKVDTVYIKQAIYVYGNQEPKSVNDRKIHPYVSAGINTLPSISLETGIFSNKFFGVGIEVNYYLYNGAIDNAVVDNSNVTIITKSVVQNESMKIGVMAFPKFSIGLKITKVF